MAQDDTADTGRQGAGPTNAELGARLIRVEEHCGFTEHTVEQLSVEMAALGKRLLEMTRKVESLERRLGELSGPSDSPGGAGGGGDGGSGEAGAGPGGMEDAGG